MKSRQFLVAALVCLAAAACRTDPNITLLERELRLQEDQLYQLKECLEDSQATLESCRRENATLRSRLPGGGTPERPLDLSCPATSTPAEAMPLAPPAINLGTPEPAGNVPEILKGRRNQPSPETTPPSSTPRRPERLPGPTADSSAGPLLPGVGEMRDAAGNSAPARNPSPARGNSRQVTKIVLNRMLTGGYNGGGRAGDAGVMVVIEPRDARGQFLDAPADVSVVVLDPALQGQAARVARWDFPAAEIASLFRQTALGRGIELEMPWPAGPPAHSDLRLFIRYTTSDGRKLEADQPIKIDMPRELSTRWVPADQSGPAGPATPAKQTARPEEPWRRAPTSASRLANAPPSPVAARDATASLPGSGEARSDKASTNRRLVVAPSGSPSRSTEPLQRPVWSPERP